MEAWRSPRALGEGAGEAEAWLAAAVGESLVNFQSCLSFGCDQQSQWGLCVLLYEQAQGEGENAPGSFPSLLPCG